MFTMCSEYHLVSPEIGDGLGVLQGAHNLVCRTILRQNGQEKEESCGKSTSDDTDSFIKRNLFKWFLSNPPREVVHLGISFHSSTWTSKTTICTYSSPASLLSWVNLVIHFTQLIIESLFDQKYLPLTLTLSSWDSDSFAFCRKAKMQKTHKFLLLMDNFLPGKVCFITTDV